MQSQEPKSTAWILWCAASSRAHMLIFETGTTLFMGYVYGLRLSVRNFGSFDTLRSNLIQESTR
jgi:hypothetical protein